MGLYIKLLISYFFIYYCSSLARDNLYQSQFIDATTLIEHIHHDFYRSFVYKSIIKIKLKIILMNTNN